MEFVTWILLLLLVAVSWILLSHKRENGGNLPPGPFGLPFIGSPWLLSKGLHVVFMELSKAYGPIFSVQIFRNRMVVLNTPEAVKDAFAGQKDWENFNGRPRPFLENDYLANTLIFNQPSPQWSKQRRILHKILNLYGEGFEGTEATIQEELKHVIGFLENKGESVDLNEVIYPSLINMLTILLTGRRYAYGNAVLQNVIELEEIGIQASGPRNSMFLTIFPFMKHVPIGPGKNSIRFDRATKQFLNDYYYESRNTYDPSVTRGMIDFLFQHQRESRLPDGSVWLEDKHIKSHIQEMVIAGSLTTRIALYSFFLIITHKPEVAKKIQHEVDTIVGTGRFTKLADRSEMPYTVAAISELLRYISHAALGVPHLTLADVTFNGFSIPRNTKLFANTWLIHHDPKFWEEPWEFKPERFLDAEGKFLPADHIKRKNLMPFGIGRRSCVGETFAKSRMFLFIATLLQRFDFRPDSASPLPSSDPRSYDAGLVLCPKQYWVSVKPRA